jgi:hypothetical protein
MATRMQQRRGTAAQWEAANPVLAAGEIGFEIDEGKFKIGDGVNQWLDLVYFADLTATGESLEGYVSLDSVGVADGVASLDENGQVPITQLGNLIDGAPETLNTLNELASALDQNPDFFGRVNDLEEEVTNLGETVEPLVGNLQSIEEDVSELSNTLSTVSGNLVSLENTVGTLTTEKAPLASPTFTGTVTLPSETSIGNVSSTEIAHLDGVTSALQGQIDAKLASSVASTTYAPLSGPTFTGNVVLPSTTSIGTVDSTELGYLNGVTSALQTQIDAKAPTASPTFTGTVSGVTKAMVGLGNVDNTSDADKPVSTAQATAIATAKSEAIADATAQVNAVVASAPAALDTLEELAAALGDDANFAATVTNSLATKAPIENPTFTGTVTVSASGVVFTDGTQTKQGVPSITTISPKTDSYTLSSLTERDTIVEVGKATAATLTIPTNASVAYPVGTTIDIIQTGAGQVTIAGAGGVTVNGTPGLKLRTQWSSATLLKRAENTWLVYGDLTA